MTSDARESGLRRLAEALQERKRAGEHYEAALGPARQMSAYARVRVSRRPARLTATRSAEPEAGLIAGRDGAESPITRRTSRIPAVPEALFEGLGKVPRSAVAQRLRR